MGFTEKHIPDKHWMVLVLGHLSPRGEVFAKDYVPPPLRKKKPAPKVISVASSLFKGLKPKNPPKRKSRTRLNITKNGAAKVKELLQSEQKEALKI